MGVDHDSKNAVLTGIGNNISIQDVSRHAWWHSNIAPIADDVSKSIDAITLAEDKLILWYIFDSLTYYIYKSKTYIDYYTKDLKVVKDNCVLSIISQNHVTMDSSWLEWFAEDMETMSSSIWLAALYFQDVSRYRISSNKDWVKLLAPLSRKNHKIFAQALSIWETLTELSSWDKDNIWKGFLIQISNIYTILAHYLADLIQLGWYLPKDTRDLIHAFLETQEQQETPNATIHHQHVLKIFVSLTKHHQSHQAGQYAKLSMVLSALCSIEAWWIDIKNICSDMKSAISSMDIAKDEDIELFDAHDLWTYTELMYMFLHATTYENSQDNELYFSIINTRFDTHISDPKLLKKILSSQVFWDLSKRNIALWKEKIWKMVLNNFNLFDGKTVIAHVELFEYLCWDEITHAQYDFLEKKSLYSLLNKYSCDELIFLLTHNMHESIDNYSPEHIKNCIQQASNWKSFTDILTLNDDQLNFLNRFPHSSENQNIIDFVLQNPDKVQHIKNNQQLLENLESDAQYIVTNHSAIEQVQDILQTDLTSETHQLKTTIEELYKQHGLKSMIDLNKSLIEKNWHKYMSIIDFFYKNFAKPKGWDWREFKKNKETCLRYIFSLPKEYIEYIQIVLFKFENDIKKISLWELRNTLKYIKSKRVDAEYLLSQATWETFDTLEKFLWQLENEQGRKEHIWKQLEDQYWKDWEAFQEMYPISWDSILRVVQIWKLLFNGDKKKFLEHNEDIYLEDEKKPFNTQQLTLIYRIYDLFENQYNINNIYNDCISLVSDDSIDQDELKTRLDYVYKKIWKHVSLDNISDTQDFIQAIFQYLGSWNDEVIDDLQITCLGNIATPTNIYDQQLLTIYQSQDKDAIESFYQNFQSMIQELISIFRPKNTSSTYTKWQWKWSGTYTNTLHPIIEALVKENEVPEQYLERLYYTDWADIMWDTSGHPRFDRILRHINADGKQYLFANLKVIGEKMSLFTSTQWKEDLSNIQEFYNSTLENLMKKYFPEI